MDRHGLLKLASDPKFIPGIYNYCDRWCERCPFTSRCLIGIDRSIAAWKMLLSYFPEQQQAILNLFGSLENLRKRVEAQFPQARAFRRPGFDDV
jgi:predicted protein tyrosine phosphatase